MTATDDFQFSVSVADKTFTIDGMLVMAEMALGSSEQQSNEAIIAVVRKCLASCPEAASLTDAEALAIGLRVSMRLQQLGKMLAP